MSRRDDARTARDPAQRSNCVWLPTLEEQEGESGDPGVGRPTVLPEATVFQDVGSGRKVCECGRLANVRDITKS